MPLRYVFEYPPRTPTHNKHIRPWDNSTQQKQLRIDQRPPKDDPGETVIKPGYGIIISWHITKNVAKGNTILQAPRAIIFVRFLLYLSP